MPEGNPAARVNAFCRNENGDYAFFLTTTRPYKYTMSTGIDKAKSGETLEMAARRIVNQAMGIITMDRWHILSGIPFFFSGEHVTLCPVILSYTSIDESRKSRKPIQWYSITKLPDKLHPAIEEVIKLYKADLLNPTYYDPKKIPEISYS